MIFRLWLLGRRSKIVFSQAAVFLFSSGVAKFERDHLLRRETNGERTLGAIDTRIHQRVEFEFDAQGFGEALHLIHFVLIDRGRNGFQFQRQIALEQKLNAPHAAVV